MGSTQRRERQKAELRQQILEAARAIVLREGFGALSMRKIAEAIEYAPSTIYLYFASREEIALQLVREAFAELMAFFADAVRIADPLERLRALGRAYVAFGFTKPESYRLIFMDDPKLSQEVLPVEALTGQPAEGPGENAFGVLEQTVAELVERKIFAPIEPALGAQIVWSGMHGVVSLRLTCSSASEHVAMDDVPERMMETLVAGLRAR